ncbi:unnamed protein product [Kuraishia capsulata CBS 1993]|uniref:Protein kinase domain-containing protein n=1 Tax=Kuraishia capsulata CBS 1993 TaxID=1382522 RepID=W6MLP8_9ASCO|nr:uncharacterized protein KUCA_T00003015001 [Kuraishia capsulata CBS 1993]CDK27038.1 unnamed protein product [Kuraishia capsulata CBS 1993]
MPPRRRRDSESHQPSDQLPTFLYNEIPSEIFNASTLNARLHSSRDPVSPYASIQKKVSVSPSDDSQRTQTAVRANMETSPKTPSKLMPSVITQSTSKTAQEDSPANQALTPSNRASNTSGPAVSPIYSEASERFSAALKESRPSNSKQFYESNDDSYTSDFTKHSFRDKSVEDEISKFSFESSVRATPSKADRHLRSSRASSFSFSDAPSIAEYWSASEGSVVPFGSVNAESTPKSVVNMPGSIAEEPRRDLRSDLQYEISTPLKVNTGVGDEPSPIEVVEGDDYRAPARKVSRAVNSPHSANSSVSWSVNNPDEWTTENVTFWLRMHRFNDSWVDYFIEWNITGQRFLDLRNYQTLKEISNAVDTSDDSTPSRFIHLLRKVLDKPSSQSTITQPASPISLLSEISSSTDSVTVPAMGASETQAADRTGSSLSMISSDSTAISSPTRVDELVSIASAPLLTSTPTGEKHGLQKQSIRQRDLKTNLGRRPVSTIESSNKSPFFAPSSPSVARGGFFRKHQKSNSSESSFFTGSFLSGSHDSDKYNKKHERSESRGSSITKMDVTESSKNLLSKWKMRAKDKAKGPLEAARTSRNPISPITPVSASSAHSAHDFSSSDKNEIARVTTTDTRPDKKTRGALSEKKSSVDSNATVRSFEPRLNLKSPVDKKSPKSVSPLTTAPGSTDALTEYQTRRPLSFQLDSKFRPISKNANSDLYILVTTDNKIFTPVNVGLVKNLNELKVKLNQSYNLVGNSGITYHLTDFGSDPGASLDDETFDKLRQTSFFGGTSKLLLKQRFLSQNSLITASTQSSISDSVESNGSSEQYPATPQYLIGAGSQPSKAKDGVDYLNFKERNATPVQKRRLPEGSPSLHSVSPKQPSLRQTSSAASNSSTETKLSTFRVIRNEKYEIDFDKKRESPYVSASSLIAKRTAPPPPEDGPQSVAGSLSSKVRTRRRRIPALGLNIGPSSGEDVQSSDMSPEQMLRLRSRSLVHHASIRRRGTGSSLISVNKFKENPISFEGAPQLDDSCDDNSVSSSDDGLWAKEPTSQRSPVLDSATISSKDSSLYEFDKMTVRPPADVVYDNLEVFFPNTDLDKPIVDDVVSPPVSPVVETQASTQATEKPPTQKDAPGKLIRQISVISTEDPSEAFQKGFSRGHRMKTIRIVAREAKEARTKILEASGKGKKESLLRRTSTKMWGRSVREVTPRDLQKGYISKLRNHNGDYKEFTWVKGGLIGKGTFGKVYLALNMTTGEMIAVKQTTIADLNKTKVDSSEILEAFLSEVQTLKDLDHVNIVQYLGFEQKDQTYSLFLEYVAGGSVGSCIRRHGCFDEPLIRFLTTQVLEGLAFIHRRGILHRDLKADNLLLEIDGTCKISDFGISKKMSDIYANNADMSMQGSIFWMAPEVVDSTIQSRKQGYSAKVDIWSLGCVVLEMYEGKRPWADRGAFSAIFSLGKTKLAPPISEETHKLMSPAGRDFLDLCFQVNPEKRPTARELLTHEFCKKDSTFKFENTRLSEMLRFNDKQDLKKAEMIKVSAQGS